MLEEVLDGKIALSALVEEALVFLIADRVLHDVLRLCISLSERGACIWCQWNRELWCCSLQTEMVLTIIAAMLFLVVGVDEDREVAPLDIFADQTQGVHVVDFY